MADKLLVKQEKVEEVISIKKESEEIFPYLTDNKPEEYFTFYIKEEESRNINIVEDIIIIKEEADKIVDEYVEEGSVQGCKENYKVL